MNRGRSGIGNLEPLRVATMGCISAGGRFDHDGAVMIVKGMLGILAGGTMVALATNLFGADAAGVLGTGSTAGMLMLLGLGLVGLGIRGRRNTMKSSTKDKAEGTFHALKGKVKETAGKLSDNPKLEAEGSGEKITGKVQKKIGQVKKVLGK